MQQRNERLLEMLPQYLDRNSQASSLCAVDFSLGASLKTDSESKLFTVNRSTLQTRLWFVLMTS